MEIIEVEVNINKSVNVEVHIQDVIEAINDEPIRIRWNYIAKILNAVENDLSELTSEQKEIVRLYLTRKLLLINQN